LSQHTIHKARQRYGIAAALTVAVLSLVYASPAFAQEQTVAGGDEGRYFSTFWLIMLILQCSVWMITYDWVGRDAEQLKSRPKFWCAIFMSVGAGGMFLMMGIHISFALPAIIAQCVIFGMYVWKRNRDLPPERRVFTRQHFGYLLRALTEKLKLGGSAGAMIQGGRGKDYAAEIELLRKDGASLDALTEGRGAQAQTSEAVVSIKELIESAVFSRATDVHLEPKETELQARFRIDGILHNVPSYPPELTLPMVSCVKVLSDMDIAEKRKPQDGTFMGKLGDNTLDFRVATTPSVHGETMVIRILDRSVGLMSLEKLGMSAKWQKTLLRLVNAPHGMLVVSGPTGSGKTTTLYALLASLDAFQKNIVTVENPIEYRLDNVTQTQVNTKAGVTFAGALRSFLRQDPDVIMVGEIRDAETARVALQSAMTGHLVLTTLHANDAITSLFRLLDLGIEPYLISSSLSAVIGQRLARVLCPNCKIPYIPKADFLKKIGLNPAKPVQLYKAQGCEECQGTGYRGRKGVFDVFVVSDAIKELIRTNPSVQLIRQEARKIGWRTLQESGLNMVIKGETSIKELVRTTK